MKFISKFSDLNSIMYKLLEDLLEFESNLEIKKGSNATWARSARAQLTQARCGSKASGLADLPGGPRASWAGTLECSR
jgi:hypothetical protein